MPENHKQHGEWNSQRFFSWVEDIRAATLIVVRAILSGHKVEQQGYKSCMALLKLGDKHSVTRLEAACLKALSYTPKPSYLNVKTILSTGNDRVIDEPAAASRDTSVSHGFTRGAEYYGRES